MATDSEHGTRKKRVVVTGMGVCTCYGNDVEKFYENLLEGNSGISRITKFDAEEFSTKIAGEIRDFDHENYVEHKMARRIDSYISYCLVAGKKAIEAAGLADYEHLDKKKAGILVGSAMGGMTTFATALDNLFLKSWRKMSPFCIPFTTTNMGGALLAMDLGYMGPNYSISTACATSNYCLLNAYHHIQKGEAHVMLAGGADSSVLPIGIGGFIACRALSSKNDEPEKASRPWDSDRDGFVMGEGAGVLVLEELEHAKARNAPILAEFLGGSISCDAHHMTEPDPTGEGVTRCIRQAMEAANVDPKDVNYVNAHATSTPAGDMAEYRAIVNALPNWKENGLKINATKSMIGHLLGGAGAVEAVATVQAIVSGWLHPNINLENPEPAVDMDALVGSEKERMHVKVGLSNSFGFGGHNSAVLFSPYEE